jgi:RNA polymerase-binding transcription factor DksA
MNCEHENIVIQEHITHPDDPIASSEWGVCKDCGEPIIKEVEDE